MARQTQTERLDRIEEKIDKMAEAIVALARAEEKIHTLTSFSKQQSEQIQNLINRIDKVENMVTQNSSTVNIINKVFWVIVVGLISAITWMLVENSI
jgi:ribosome-binding ATPase YchF (GTP1/OBG family)